MNEDPIGFKEYLRFIEWELRMLDHPLYWDYVSGTVEIYDEMIKKLVILLKQNGATGVVYKRIDDGANWLLEYEYPPLLKHPSMKICETWANCDPRHMNGTHDTN